MAKRPAFQFYPADWRKDTALQGCSLLARGLWHEMLCLMHECEPYGHLSVNGKPMKPSQIARLVGITEKEYGRLLDELFDAGVPSRTDDGCICSRRMVRDEQLRNARAEGGKKGGNPDLVGGYNQPGFVYVARRQSDTAVKIGISTDPAKRVYKIRQQFKGDQIDIIGKYLVEDMGAVEAEMHAAFSENHLGGEWFLIGSDGLSLLDIRLKAKSKATSTPSSSSSSSENHSAPSGAGGEPPKTAERMTKDELWSAGKSLLEQGGMPRAQCGAFVGKLVKDYDAEIVVEAVRRAVVERPVDPVSFLKAVCQTVAGERKPQNRQDAREQANRDIAAQVAAEIEGAAQ
ncbi:protein of unknown function [Ralstonia solanacearum CMR15]|nr:protein of unknown function [Ralstonia solanacearum CMR15]